VPTGFAEAHLQGIGGTDGSALGQGFLAPTGEEFTGRRGLGTQREVNTPRAPRCLSFNRSPREIGPLTSRFAQKSSIISARLKRPRQTAAQECRYPHPAVAKVVSGRAGI
jgi:hypothetical protein